VIKIITSLKPSKYQLLVGCRSFLELLVTILNSLGGFFQINSVPCLAIFCDSHGNDTDGNPTIDTEKKKRGIGCTMQTTPIAFSCSNWMLSTPNVSSIVLISCRRVLSKIFATDRSSFNKARTLHSLCSTTDTGPETLPSTTFISMRLQKNPKTH
jgi:hypothetical protein